MRLSPVAIFHRSEPGKAVEAARRQSATTHAAPECLAACAFYAGLLVRAINGEPKDRVLVPSPWPKGGAVAKIAAGGWQSKPRDQIRSSGYVIHSLGAALWAVGGGANFEDAVVSAVNLGDDADTVTRHHRAVGRGDLGGIGNSGAVGWQAGVAFAIGRHN